MEKIDELFSGSDIVIIGVESDSLFSERTLTKLSSFNDSLESIDLISKVTSIFNQKQIIPDENGFNIESILEEIPNDSLESENLVRRIKKSGVLGNLVSNDFKTMCFIGQINSSFEYDEFEFRKKIFELVNRFNTPENFMCLASQLLGPLLWKVCNVT